MKFPLVERQAGMLHRHPVCLHLFKYALALHQLGDGTRLRPLGAAERVGSGIH